MMAYQPKSHSYRPESRQYKALPYQPSRERFKKFVTDADKAVKKEASETPSPEPDTQIQDSPAP